MSRYQKKSPVPWIVAAVLLLAFVGVVVFATRGDDETPPEPVREAAAPAPKPAPKEVAEPSGPSAEEVDRALRRATTAWRAFALALCEEQQWPSQKAVAFLEKVTWSDRDREKQHAHGLAALRRMAGVDAQDPAALAEALRGEVDLDAFFARNWSKLEVEWEPEPEVTVLDDAWKEKRVQWGFPPDAPVDTLQGFKHFALAASLNGWRQLAGRTIQEMAIDDAAKVEKFVSALGDGPQQAEAKMHAALRVLLEMPDGSVKDVAEEFFRRSQADREKFEESMRARVDAAIRAAAEAG